MTARQESMLSQIEDAWKELRDAREAVPLERMEEVGVEGTWSVKDLIGHISTRENEAIDCVGRYLPRRDLDELAWGENIDEFNRRAVEGKRSTPLRDLLADLEKTHAGLVRFIEGVEEDVLGVSEVETRLRVDTFEHYTEHAATIRRWLDRDAG